MSPPRAPALPVRLATACRPSLVSLVAFIVVMLVTVALAVTSSVLTDRDETRLLRLQTRQAGILLQSNLQVLETPLASAAQIAATGGGDSASFRRFITTFRRQESRLASVGLWRVRGGHAQRVALIGGTQQLTPTRTAAFVAAARTSRVGVVLMLTGPQRRIGYSYAATSGGVRYVIYVERLMRPRYQSVVSRDSPFADLRYAVYLGSTVDNRHLLSTSQQHLPLPGRTATAVVPYGSTTLTLVASSDETIGGRDAASRWWFIMLIGTVVALGGGLLTDRLVKRRRAAEHLAREIDDLLQDQRTIAESLQRALVPDGLPAVAGLDIAARYVPGVNGIEIGGDWFDVIPIDDTHVFITVGDVSGRGLGAGSVMASLHFAIRAFVSEGHDPATVLDLLTRMLVVRRDKRFATVLCGYLDVTTRELTIANAGHLPPLVLDANGARFVETVVGPPIGVTTGVRYRTVHLTLDPGSTLLVYTDGVVERRGETLDDGLERLRRSTCHATDTVDEMLADVIGELVPAGTADDLALLGLRWTAAGWTGDA